MAGNLPVTLTTFETELQAKINTVGGATPIEDIVSYYRAGENIPTINNTALTAEVQSRLNAVSSSTTAEEFLTLAASFGKVSNTNQSDLQSALLAIADIPTNSELATALSPIATSSELTPLAKSSELAPLATSTNVSDSESNVISAINSNTDPVLQNRTVVQLSSEINAGQSFSIVPPDSESFIRLTLLTTSNQVISAASVYAGTRKVLDTIAFRTRLDNQNEDSSTAIPSRFVIAEHLGANFNSTLGSGLSLSVQFNGTVLSPISGGRGETIEIETGTTARYFYAYEVWK